MADVKISALTDATTVGGTDEFPIVQAGVTKRATVTELKTGLALTKSDVGLGNVDNTSDANKPVSTATSTALSGKSDVGHTHTLANVSDVTITVSNLNSLDDGIDSTLHFHAADRARANHTGTQAASTISDFNSAADARIAAASINALSDVVITTPSNGQVLKYNGTNWVNDTDATGGGGGALDDLTDVVITTPSTGQVLKYNGTNWINDTDATGGGGSVTVTGTPADNQIAIWTGSSAIEGDSDLTYNTSTNTLGLVASGKIAVGGTNIIDDSAGTTTLSNIDALDATTESTVEAAIDTLPNLTSVQGRTVTLADAGADAFLGWDDSANAYENLTAQEAADILLTVPPTVVVESSTARTLAASDNGKIIRCTSASAVTITVPTAFSGYGCVIVRAGTGIVTIAASSTTLNGSSLVLNGQYLSAAILPTGSANTFDVIGATGGVDNDAATAAPTANDDAGDGYAVGSKWIDTTNDQVYFCVDATTTAAVWRQVGNGTVTSVTLTQPAAGLTITSSGTAITTSGTRTFALANDLAAVEGLAANGLATRTATDTWTVRTITAPAAGITVSNGDGVSGNPTLALANDLAAVEGLSTTGIVRRTAADTWSAGANLDHLDDVVITTPSTGQVLKYNGTNWVNDTDATAGGSTALDDLSDVAITSPTTGHILRHNGTNFVNDLGTTHFQAADQDLTDIAGLAASNDDFLQRKSGAWANRTVAQVRSDLQGTGTGADTEVGFRHVPQNSQSAAYTLVAADAGKHIYHPSTDANARTFTIPANSSVAFPIGTSITFINETSQVVTIAITTDTLVLAGTGTNGSRSLAQYGVATAIKVTSTRWYINGTGLT